VTIPQIEDMNIKRTIAALLFFAAVTPISAQIGRPQYNHSANNFGDDHNVYYGLRLGLAVANVSSDDPQLNGSSAQAGLNVGAVIGFQLADDFPVFLESGLYYTQKGGKGNDTGKKFTYDLNYLEVPILVKYKYSFDDDLSIQPFGGGYLALGVSGKVKNYDERSAFSSFSEDFFKRFDGGLRIGCGLEYQMLYVDVAYEFGLANICHSEFESSHNGCFYINAGVNF